jgi:hypothetical protein
MLAKFNIEYIIQPEHNKRLDHHLTDDPVEAEDFLMTLLSMGARICSIQHEGLTLEPPQADRMLRVAAERLSARLIGRCLNLDTAAVRHRFGLAA